MFFETTRQAKDEVNKGLEALTKMCLNGPTRKMGFNPPEAKVTRFMTETDIFLSIYLGRGKK